ncbi:hypothetical protein [Nocardia rosealba]|nr:hypothetical protein [Nocardia rosealba]
MHTLLQPGERRGTAVVEGDEFAVEQDGATSVISARAVTISG